MKASTYHLVLSMVINGHDTSLDNVTKATGCNVFEINAVMPSLWDYAKNCPVPEFEKLYALRKEIRKH